MSTLWPDSDAYKTVSGEGKGWLTVDRVAVRVVTLFEMVMFIFTAVREMSSF